MTRIKVRVDEDTKDQVEELFNDIGSTTETACELQAIKEFEDNYKENSKFIDIDDLKKRINMMLESV
jgi:predicted transcriptional regulator